MKKFKRILIGFICLWVLAFLIIWGITLFKKTPVKKLISSILKTEGKKLFDFTQDNEDMEAGFDIGQPPAQEGIPVRCYRVSLWDTFKDELPVMGTIKGSVEIELRFEVNGVIESINFMGGDVLYKGDLIAALNQKDAQLKVDYSKSKLKITKIQALAANKKLQIHKALYDIGSIIKAKLEEVELEAKSAEYQIISAKVELESAEAELEKTKLYAPRDGVMGSRDAEIGEFVTPQNRIAIVYDVMKVFVELGIVEKDIDKIALGLGVVVTVDAYPDISFTGTVDNILPVIEGRSRTLTLRVGIANEDAMLLPGMFARSLITVAEFNDAIVIPSFGLNKLDTGYEVFVVNEDSFTVSARPVQVAYITTDYSVIDSGIYEGEVVVVDTPQELKDEMSVKVIEIQESGIEE